MWRKASCLTTRMSTQITPMDVSWPLLSFFMWFSSQFLSLLFLFLFSSLLLLAYSLCVVFRLLSLFFLPLPVFTPFSFLYFCGFILPISLHWPSFSLCFEPLFLFISASPYLFPLCCYKTSCFYAFLLQYLLISYLCFSVLILCTSIYCPSICQSLCHLSFFSLISFLLMCSSTDHRLTLHSQHTPASSTELVKLPYSLTPQHFVRERHSDSNKIKWTLCGG